MGVTDELEDQSGKEPIPSFCKVSKKETRVLRFTLRKIDWCWWKEWVRAESLWSMISQGMVDDWCWLKTAVNQIQGASEYYVDSLEQGKSPWSTFYKKRKEKYIVQVYNTYLSFTNAEVMHFIVMGKNENRLGFICSTKYNLRNFYIVLGQCDFSSCNFKSI